MSELHPTLSIALQAAVPLHMHDVRDWTFEHRAQAAAECSNVIAAHGDDLMYGGKHCAEAFNKLALGLACAAYAPGGITFLGDHYEASEYNPEAAGPPSTYNTADDQARLDEAHENGSSDA